MFSVLTLYGFSNNKAWNNFQNRLLEFYCSTIWLFNKMIRIISCAMLWGDSTFRGGCSWPALCCVLHQVSSCFLCLALTGPIVRAHWGKTYFAVSTLLITAKISSWSDSSSFSGSCSQSRLLVRGDRWQKRHLPWTGGPWVDLNDKGPESARCVSTQLLLWR